MSSNNSKWIERNKKKVYEELKQERGKKSWEKKKKIVKKSEGWGMRR